MILRPFESRGKIASYSVSEFLTFFGMMGIEAIKPFNTNNGFPLIFLVLTALLIIYKPLKLNRSILFFLSVAGIFLAFMTLFKLLAEVDTSFGHIRYTMMIFPFLAISSALLIRHILRIHKTVGWSVLMIYLISDDYLVEKKSLFILYVLRILV